jgi:hypothetical protein
MITIDIKEEDCYEIVEALLTACCKAPTSKESDLLAELRRAILERKRD